MYNKKDKLLSSRSLNFITWGHGDQVTGRQCATCSMEAGGGEKACWHLSWVGPEEDLLESGGRRTCPAAEWDTSAKSEVCWVVCEDHGGWAWHSQGKEASKAGHAGSWVALNTKLRGQEESLMANPFLRQTTQCTCPSGLTVSCQVFDLGVVSTEVSVLLSCCLHVISDYSF